MRTEFNEYVSRFDLHYDSTGYEEKFMNAIRQGSRGFTASLSLWALMLSSFLAAFGLGFTKFVALGYYSSEVYRLEDKDWIVQVVGSIMTFGPVLAYFFAAPLASAIQKRWMMVFSSLAVSGLAILGWTTGWVGSVWTYLFFVGWLMGVFSVAKMASVPLEAIKQNMSTTFVNALASITFIVGMLLGIFLGTEFYTEDPSLCLTIGIAVFACSGLPVAICSYEGEKYVPYKRATGLLLEDTVRLIFKYPFYLFSTPLLWGVAGVVGLAVTVYAELIQLGDAKACSLMPLFAAVGTIIGNGLSPKLQAKRYLYASLSGVVMAVLITAMPYLVGWGVNLSGSLDFGYYLASSLMVAMGVMFGICTNLIDAEFLEKVAAEKKEGAGAALQSALIALFSFVIGGLLGLAIYTNWLDSTGQFYVLGLLTLVGVAVVTALAVRQGALDAFLSRSFAFIMKHAIALRYRIRWHGLEKIDGSQGGMLFLPNHPSESDPVVLCSELWPRYRLRPVVTEIFYHMKGVNTVMNWMRAVGMPDLEMGAGEFKKQRIAQNLNDLAEALKAGDNVLMYPSGRLKRSADEKLGAASGVHQILQKNKDTKVVLVRSTGLWGSRFSTAITGQTPDLVLGIKSVLKMIFMNLIFFSPRRQIDIEVEVAPQDFPKDGDVAEINRYLEAFYNKNGDEPMQLLSDAFWSSKKPELVTEEAVSKVDLSGFDTSKVEQVLVDFAKDFKMERERVQTASRFAEDLGMDSISKAELLMWLDEKYEVSDVDLADLRTMEDLIAMALGERRETKTGERVKAPEGWLEQGRPGVQAPKVTSIQENFLQTCDRMSEHVANADGNTGVLTWKRFKLATLLFSKVIAAMPGERVGIMLPATLGANITIMAALLAKKVPVMFNWTVGKNNLEQACESSEVEVILTSSTFLDKLPSLDLGNVMDKLVFLEDIKRDNLGIGEKLLALFSSRKSSAKLMRDLELNDVSPNDPAVILYTSGSESAPKGVPLTHENILSNIRGAVEVVNFAPEDVLYGFLPPFHSFGFTITTIMPLTTGLKAVYHPNPTESRQLAKGCEQWGVTHMCATPSFMRGILKASKPGQLSSLKTVVSGAEKLSDDVRQQVEALGNTGIYEGYGITECSPVLTLNRPGDKPEGVGKPLPGVEVKIVDPVSYEEMSLGDRGLIIANGKNIFKGYTNTDKYPFVKFEGKEWYDTGDLGFLTPDGALCLAGRQKRFVKVAGEMISLPAMEEALRSMGNPGDEGAMLAVEAVEIEGQRPVFWLFNNMGIEVEQANAHLKESGFSNLSKLSQSVILEELPLLGTGKIDYRSLKDRMSEDLGVSS